MGGKTGVMLCGHGSRDVAAVTEFANLSKTLTARLSEYEVEYGYLEFATPIITGLDKLRERGVSDVLAVPGMLFAAGHAKNDIPSVLNTYQAGQSDLQIRYGRELGIDPKMLKAASDRVEEALASVSDDILGTKPCWWLSAVARRTPMPTPTWQKSCGCYGKAWALAGGDRLLGVTFPLVEPALEHATRLGYKRIVVFPYFLFTGVLVRRIYEYTDLVAAKYPEIEFVKAPYLNDHPMVVETFVDRLREIVDGTGNMNCQMCKYRTRSLGSRRSSACPKKATTTTLRALEPGTARRSTVTTTTMGTATITDTVIIIMATAMITITAMITGTVTTTGTTMGMTTATATGMIITTIPIRTRITRSGPKTPGPRSADRRRRWRQHPLI